MKDIEWYTPGIPCDLCPSQSYYLVVFESGSLYFCRHHYLKNEDTFFEIAEDIVDESELLVSGR